jgi:hypothetical protein
MRTEIRDLFVYVIAGRHRGYTYRHQPGRLHSEFLGRRNLGEGRLGHDATPCEKQRNKHLSVLTPVWVASCSKAIEGWKTEEASSSIDLAYKGEKNLI